MVDVACIDILPRPASGVPFHSTDDTRLIGGDTGGVEKWGIGQGVVRRGTGLDPHTPLIEGWSTRVCEEVWARYMLQ